MRVGMVLVHTVVVCNRSIIIILSSLDAYNSKLLLLLLFIYYYGTAGTVYHTVRTDRASYHKQGAACIIFFHSWYTDEY